MKFTQYIKNEKLDESAVGQRGRTSSEEVTTHVKDNPALYKEFKKIVKKLGGKSVARKLLDTMSMPIGWDIHESEIAEEAEEILESVVNEVDKQDNIIDIEGILRKEGFKIKSVTKDEITLMGSKGPEDAIKILKDYKVSATKTGIKL